MNIHEYQAKQLLAKYGVPLARGGVAFTSEEAEKVARDVGGTGWAVKAQILAGDRGRAGGVKLVASIPDVRETAAGSTRGNDMTGYGIGITCSISPPRPFCVTKIDCRLNR